MSSKIFSKINPLAGVCSGLLFIPGSIAGLLAGIIFSINTGILLSVISGGLVMSVSYFLYTRIQLTEEKFFKHVSLVLSSVFGFLWGGMSIGPILFMYGLSVLTTGSALLIGGVSGMLIFLLFNRLAKLIFKIKEVNSVNIQTFGLMGMTIAGCIGLFWGPMGWIVCSSLGTVAGVLVGAVSNFISKFNNTAKILSGLFGVSGTLIGVMLGAIVSTLIPMVSPIMISLFFGIAFMLIGSVAGITCGNFYPKFDLQDSSLQHRLYQAVSLLVIVFSGYLGGGLLGIIFLPVNSIIISQALGMLVLSGFYGMITAGYYLIKNILNRSGGVEETLIGQPGNSTAFYNTVEAEYEKDPKMVKSVVTQFMRDHSKSNSELDGEMDNFSPAAARPR